MAAVITKSVLINFAIIEKPMWGKINYFLSRMRRGNLDNFFSFFFFQLHSNSVSASRK